jgi:hypothetical protein
MIHVTAHCDCHGVKSDQTGGYKMYTLVKWRLLCAADLHAELSAEAWILLYRGVQESYTSTAAAAAAAATTSTTTTTATTTTTTTTYNNNNTGC